MEEKKCSLFRLTPLHFRIASSRRRLSFRSLCFSPCARARSLAFSPPPFFLRAMSAVDDDVALYRRSDGGRGTEEDDDNGNFTDDDEEEFQGDDEEEERQLRVLDDEEDEDDDDDEEGLVEDGAFFSFGRTGGAKREREREIRRNCCAGNSATAVFSTPASP